MRNLVRAPLAAVLAALAAGAPQAIAQAPVGDSVVVSDLADTGTGLSFGTVDAHSGPSGENPTGTASWHLGDHLGPTWGVVTVTCLSVSGNTAVIGFSGVFHFQSNSGPTAGLIRVVDRGDPASSQDSFEWVEVQGFAHDPPIPGPTDCSAYPATFDAGTWGRLAVNETGDIVVTDAPRPAPTSKDQCKDGGWRNFPGFNNQGDCVSFVATTGKRSP